MRIDRLTAKMQEGLQESQTLASEMQHQELSPEHLFLALLRQPDGLARPLLEKLNVQSGIVEQQIEDELRRRPKVSGANTGQTLGVDLRSALDQAEKEMSKLKDEYVSVEHFLLALVDSPTTGIGKILRAQGITR